MKKYIVILIVLSMIFVAGCATSAQGSGAQAAKQSSALKVTGPKPVATILMANGSKIDVELYPSIAPNTVNNFIALANKGFYNGLTFHRVIEGFMIQGGDPKGDGTGGPGYSIKGEFSSNGFKNPVSHVRGVISMARSNDPNSAGSQFFIMHADEASLDGQYAAFGKVKSGMDVVDAIAATKTGVNDKPVKAAVIKKISVKLNGYKAQAPKKISR